MPIARDSVRDAPGHATSRISADLEAALRSRLDDPSVIVGVPEPFGSGHSGFTYAVDVERAGERASLVLRLSPPNARIAGPADIGRQARIMKALGDAGLPVPGVVAYDTSPAIDGRSFGLFELVDGVDWKTAVATTSDREVAKAALATMSAMHRLGPLTTGLGGESPFSPREELRRWEPLLDRSPLAVRDRGARLLADLHAAAPAGGTGNPAGTADRAAAVRGPSLTHGDYHFGNLLFRDGAVVAILDWEIAALGDPLVDFGCLAVASIRRRYEPEPNPTGSLDVSVADLVELAGVDDAAARWHIAASCLKYAAILGYNRSLHESGKRRDEVYALLSGTMAGLVADGAAILRDGIAGW